MIDITDDWLKEFLTGEYAVIINENGKKQIVPVLAADKLFANMESAESIDERTGHVIKKVKEGVKK